MDREDISWSRVMPATQAPVNGVWYPLPHRQNVAMPHLHQSHVAVYTVTEQAVLRTRAASTRAGEMPEDGPVLTGAHVRAPLPRRNRVQNRAGSGKLKRCHRTCAIHRAQHTVSSTCARYQVVEPAWPPWCAPHPGLWSRSAADQRLTVATYDGGQWRSREPTRTSGRGPGRLPFPT